MIRYYCPACWTEVACGTRTCPSCRADIDEVLAGRAYAEKLIAALSHPDPETPIRAATILGQLRATDAIQPLRELLKTSRDSYIKAAAAAALGEIGGPEACVTLTELTHCGDVIVRHAAATALERLPTTDDPSR
jgi:HEAT repeat protein